MSQKNRNQASKDLHSIFRSQIVQKYPPQNQYKPPIFLEQAVHEENRHDLFEPIMRQNDIVEEYMEYQQTSRRRSIMNFQNLMASESDHHQVPSRNSSLSSKDNNLDFHNKSYDKMPNLFKNFSDDFMDIQQPIPQRKSYNTFQIPQNPMHAIHRMQSLQSQEYSQIATKQKQRNQKINKIQQVGCNCRKSKCLKMYCQCFHLQIFCSQNCNCVDCGNTQPNEGHQQAVIDALTRNPKAFQQQKPAVQGFTLGVELAQIKKGCKCKKTKCLKKYCQCYNSGTKCGIFCKCQSCQNNN